MRIIFKNLGLRAWFDRHQEWIAVTALDDSELFGVHGWSIHDVECPAFIRKAFQQKRTA